MNEPIFQVSNCDCLDRMIVMTSRTDLIVTDPPYCYDVDYGGYHDDSDRDAYLPWLTERLGHMARILSPTGSLWLLLPDEWIGEGICAIKSLGLHIQNLVVWYETFGQATRRKFARTKRIWIYATKHPKTFTFNDTAARVPSDRQLKYNDKRGNPAGKIADDVWKFSRVCGTFGERIPGFPTQLPMAMTDRIVRVCASPGDTVFDPFSGSATVGVSALAHGCNYIGCELNPEYARLSINRLSKVVEQKTPE